MSHGSGLVRVTIPTVALVVVWLWVWSNLIVVFGFDDKALP